MYESREYKEGYEAYHNGKRCINPYNFSRDGTKHSDWDDGYYSATLEGNPKNITEDKKSDDNYDSTTQGSLIGESMATLDLSPWDEDDDMWPGC